MFDYFNSIYIYTQVDMQAPTIFLPQIPPEYFTVLLIFLYLLLNSETILRYAKINTSCVYNAIIKMSGLPI